MSLAKSETRCVHAACADNHTLVLSDHGQVFGFGLNRSGEIGQGKSDDVHMYFVPTKIKMSGNALDIVTGRNHSLVTSTEGVHSFGQNMFEQLGRDVQTGYFPGDVCFKTTKKPRIIQMDAGHTHSVLLDDQGWVYTFGTGMVGQLGHGEKECKVKVATRIELKRKAKEVTTAASTTFVVGFVPFFNISIFYTNVSSHHSKHTGTGQRYDHDVWSRTFHRRHGRVWKIRVHTSSRAYVTM